MKALEKEISTKTCVVKLVKKISYDDHIINLNFLAEVQKLLGENYYRKFVINSDELFKNKNLPINEEKNYPDNFLQIKTKTNKIKKSLKNKKEIVEDAFTKVIPMKNFKNTQYVGNIFVGEPGQEIPVIFDTGSGNLWVTSSLCTSESCKKELVYDRKISKNFNKIGLGVEVTFGTGVVSGEINEDSFKLGSIVIPKQKFAEILEQKGSVFNNGKFSGILGLGYPGMSAYNMMPVFDTIIADKLLQKNIMGFYFSQNEDTDGEVTFGVVNPERYEGEIRYYNVTDRYYWTIDLDDILYDGMSLGLCKNGCKAIADTGTTLLTGPTEDVRKLLNTIPTDKSCNNYENTGTLEFVFSGDRYVLYRDEYILVNPARNMEKLNNREMNKSVQTTSSEIRQNSNPSNDTNDIGKTTCSALIMPLDVPSPHGPAWILGGTFLQKFYSVYDRDNNRVGLALARHKKERKFYDE